MVVWAVLYPSRYRASWALVQVSTQFFSRNCPDSEMLYIRNLVKPFPPLDDGSKKKQKKSLPKKVSRLRTQRGPRVRPPPLGKGWGDTGDPPVPGASLQLTPLEGGVSCVTWRLSTLWSAGQWVHFGIKKHPIQWGAAPPFELDCVRNFFCVEPKESGSSGFLNAK